MKSRVGGMLVFFIAAACLHPWQPVAVAQDPAQQKILPADDPLPEGAIARYGSARLSHGRPVSSVAFSPDGKRLFSASEDFTLRVWDVATGAEIQHLMTGTEQLNGMAPLDGGARLATFTFKTGVSTFDLESGKRTKQFERGGLLVIAASPDSKFVAAGGSSGVHLLNLEDGSEARQLQSAEGMVERMAFTRDRDLLAVGTSNADKVIEWIDYKNDKRLASSNVDSRITALAISGTLCLIATVDGKEVAHLWRVDLNDKEKTPHRLDASPLTRDQYISHMAVSPDRRSVYAVGSSRELRGFDLRTKELRFAVKAGQIASPQCIAVSPDGKTIATGGGAREYRIRLWDAETGEEKPPSLPNGRSELFGLSVSADGKIVAAGNSTGQLTIWDGATSRPLHELTLPGVDMQLRAAVSPDGRQVASSGFNGVAVWDVASGKHLFQIAAPQRIHPIVFSRDGKHLYAGGCQGALYVLDVAGRKWVKTIQAHEQEIWSIDLSPDGSMIATASFDRSAGVFDTETGREIARRQDHKWYVRTAVFSPNGMCLATAGEGENAIYVWEIASGELIHKLTPEWPATSLAWRRRGRVLVSAHSYDRLHFWDVAVGKWLGWSRRRPGPGNWKIIAPPGEDCVYTAGSDSAVLKWNLSQIVGEVPPLAPANLSDERLAATWNELAQANPAAAHRAVWRLAGEGDQAVEFLAGKLSPKKQAKVDEAAVRRLIRQLDDDSFAVRAAASQQLEEFDAGALPVLRDEEKKAESTEVRFRLRALIRKLQVATNVAGLSRDELQAARAMQVLLYHESPASRKLLETVARAESESLTTKQAKSILERRERKPPAER